MFTDIINQFENIAEAVKQSELQEVPFRHLFVHGTNCIRGYGALTELDKRVDLSTTDEYVEEYE